VTRPDFGVAKATTPPTIGGSGCNLNASAQSPVGLIGFFTLFFFIGWKIGDSPLNYSLKTVKEQANIVKHRLFQIPYINIAANKQEQWEEVVNVLHVPELKEDPRFKERDARKKNRNCLKP